MSVVSVFFTLKVILLSAIENNSPTHIIYFTQSIREHAEYQFHTHKQKIKSFLELKKRMQRTTRQGERIQETIKKFVSSKNRLFVGW